MSEARVQFYDFGEFRFDVINNQLLRGEDPVEITQKTLEVLRFLIENRGITVRKGHLLESLWQGVFVEEKTLMQHIYLLRKVFKENGSGEVFIKTVSGNGYSFVADVGETPFEPHATNGRLSNGNGTAADTFADHDIARQRDASTQSFFSKGLKFAAIIALVALVSLGLLLAGGGLPGAAPAKLTSVAVLPFQQIGGEKDDKLGLGVADILITKIGGFDELFVTPTSSIIRYANTENVDLFEIGEKLGVESVIDGTIQRDGDIVRVTIRVYDVKGKRQMWSQTFDERYSDVFTLQDKIGDQISREFSLKIRGESGAATVAQYSRNPEANEAYSKGLFNWNHRYREGLDNAARYFQAAIDADPDFALAYAYLSDTYMLMDHYKTSDMPSESLIARAEAAAVKALVLSPNNSEALTALAFVRTREGKTEESIELLQRAIAARSNNATARQRLAWLLPLTDDIENAVAEMRLAQRLDPESPSINTALAQMLNFSRRPAEGVVYAERSLAIAAMSVKTLLVLAASYEQMGEYSKALELIENALKVERDEPYALFAKSRVLARSGHGAGAEEVFNQLLARDLSPEFRYPTAVGYMALGDTKNAMKWLDLVTQNENKSNLDVYNLKYDHNLDEIRKTAEFKRSTGE
ncbi:MAG: winged helix-turn-helix domain-containing protein [Pyrinomonadaceae bacterium]